MASELTFSLVTPNGTVFNEPVSELDVPTPSGSIAILADHMPLVTPIDTGVLTIQSAEKKVDHYAVGEGTLTVRDNQATLTTEVAEHASKIDELEVRRELEQAQAKLETQLTDEEVAFTEGNLERHLARLEAFERHKTYHARH